MIDRFVPQHSRMPTPEPDPRRTDAMPGLARTVALVGLMGAGKTSVGRRLAALCGAPFVDADHAIEEAAGMAVAEIFASLGEPAFRDGERRVIARLLKGAPCVLATGGGAFIDPGSRAEIARRATSVWLRAEVDVLWHRVRGREGRPLLLARDPRAVLADLARRRDPIYAKADVVVDSRKGSGHDAMARKIVAALVARDAADPDRAPTLGARS